MLEALLEALLELSALGSGGLDGGWRGVWSSWGFDVKANFRKPIWRIWLDLEGRVAFVMGLALLFTRLVFRLVSS